MRYLLLLFLLATAVTGCSSSLVIRVNGDRQIKTFVKGDTLFIQQLYPDHYEAPKYGCLEETKP